MKVHDAQWRQTLQAIESFEDLPPEEDVGEILARIEEAFDFSDAPHRLEELMRVLRYLAQDCGLRTDVVPRRLWERVLLEERSEARARLIMHVVWFAVPSFFDWVRPLSKEQKDRWFRLTDDGVQRFLDRNAAEIWRLVEDPSEPVAAAGAMLLGTMHHHSAIDMSLLLDLCRERSDPDFRASVLAAVGRAGQFAQYLHGDSMLDEVLPVLRGDFFADDDVMVAMSAVWAYAVLDRRLPAPASRTLAAAISAPRGLPCLWRGEELPWADWDTSRLARVTLKFAQPDDPSLIPRVTKR